MDELKPLPWAHNYPSIDFFDAIYFSCSSSHLSPSPPINKDRLNAAAINLLQKRWMTNQFHCTADKVQRMMELESHNV